MAKVLRIDDPIDPERAFLALFADSPTAFWLDSSRPGGSARFSFMGDASGPLAATVAYDVDAGRLAVERAGETELRSESIFDFLEREAARLPAPAPDLPFDFQCGFAGYLAYELKADCGATPAHSSPRPDAALILADRLIAFDHQQNHTYLLCLTQLETEDTAQAWLSTTAARLAGLKGADPVGAPGEGSPEPPRCCSDEPSPGAPHLARSRPQYLNDIAACHQYLRAGDSYEICLTNSLELELETEPLQLYRRLRRVNPAPFASYLRFGDLAVLSSSPERFLRIDTARRVEAQPIKGTSRRSPDPAEDARLAAALRADEKNRAENMMIADLLRNDLGRVCEFGSIAVPALMEVETFETVHQLVTTVTGRLRPQVSAPECVRACFPPGSMTGAPKLRTMEILDQLEAAPRGIYSGAIGWFAGAGACDLSVTIRTIVLDRGRATVGAGGAIVVQSDPAAEYEEMLLKAAAPLRAVDPGAEAAISLADPRPVAVSAPPASAHEQTS
jgi:para-aminobenzoate synthetase